ncbi:MAG: hypothetical protein R2706_01155 [Acidimicrobiales bacterium]
MESHAPLPAGTYDVLVVDAEGDETDMRIEAVIVAGDFKGEVVTIMSTGETQDEIVLLGTPGQLVVDDAGAPHLLW